ncbi:MAG: C39 family peptidase [Vicinamibacteria bacterium]|nr:C39 family peptidase [Vicinamibacteria bacterium]
MLSWGLLSMVLAWPVPFVPQQENTCAAASLAMVMRYWGQSVSSDEIADTRIDERGEGIRGSRLVDFARSKGLYAIAFEGDSAHLIDYITKGRPLIVALGAGSNRFHDVVVVGFDGDKQELIVHDPARGPFRRVDRRIFEKQWNESGRWTLLVLPDER